MDRSEPAGRGGRRARTRGRAVLPKRQARRAQLHASIGEWTSLIEWVKGDGAAQDLTGPEWHEYEHRGKHAEHLFDVLDAWVADKRRDEILERAQLLRQPYAAVRL